jgi:hypothetical protein
MQEKASELIEKKDFSEILRSLSAMRAGLEGSSYKEFRWAEVAFVRLSSLGFRHVRDSFRGETPYRSTFDWNLKDFSDYRVLFVRRCMGLRVPLMEFRKHPRLCVLASLLFGDDFRDVVCEEYGAAYLYAKYVVGGRLPEGMHSRLVMESFLSQDCLLKRYFSEFGLH